MRNLLLTLTALLAMIALAACGGGGEAPPPEPTGSMPAETASPAEPEGLVVMDSDFSVDETYERLDTAVAESPATVLGEVDHGANAERAGEQLRPTKLLIVGNPKLGTPLMEASPTAGIDLPQKFLVYEDEEGQVKLAYNDPSYVAKRHGISGQDAVLEKISKALRMFAQKATSEDGAGGGQDQQGEDQSGGQGQQGQGSGGQGQQGQGSGGQGSGGGQGGGGQGSGGQSPGGESEEDRSRDGQGQRRQGQDRQGGESEQDRGEG